MTQHVKTMTVGAVVSIIGMVVTFSAVMVATGGYREKINICWESIPKQDERVGDLQRSVSGIERDISSIKVSQAETRADIKKLLEKVK